MEDTINDARFVGYTYDASGNPLNWTDYRELTWVGRQLDSIMSPDGAMWTFEYDHNGLRTEREYSYYGDVILNTKYTWVDEKLVREYRSGGMNASPITIEYFYDGEELIGFTYNGENYYYGKTNNGEIRFIYDSNGEIVTTYLYDAWGAPISITGSEASTVGAINPFRYKSYYYDSETRLYYLRSRSYDPAVGRFLNADSTDFLGVTGTVLSYNLFTYCENNPVNNYDANGFARISIQKNRNTWWLLELLLKYIPNIYTNDIISYTLFNRNILGIGVKITLGGGLQSNANGFIGRLFSNSALELSWTISSVGYATVFGAMGADWTKSYLKFGILISPFNSIIFGGITIELSVSHWTMAFVTVACITMPYLGTAITSIGAIVKTASISTAKLLVKVVPHLIYALV